LGDLAYDSRYADLFFEVITRRYQKTPIKRAAHAILIPTLPSTAENPIRRSDSTQP
jgi:hypothetical protein